MEVRPTLEVPKMPEVVKNMRSKKNEITIVIIRSQSHHIHHQFTTEDHEGVETIDNVEYKWILSDAWTLPTSFIDSLKNRGKYMLVFFEKEKYPVTELVKGDISSEMVFYAKKYNGAKNAFSNEFKTKRSWNIPIWAVGILFIVFIVVVVVILTRSGISLDRLIIKPELAEALN